MADVKNNQVAISVKNVSKSFRLPHEQHSGLKQALVNLAKRNKRRGYEIQQVLDDVSFDINKGDFFGIVGRNGSGKSTLLKLISEIYTPDSGEIQVNGSLTPFIELGVGFNPELTGRENIYMNGALLGFSNKQMNVMYDEIVEFAELERFMDQKLKNYSSGMQVRLAFSIAIRADTDILVLDEVLAVGDEAFQKKCNDFFVKIKNDKSKTVVLVTHSMDSVRRYCNKAVMIRDGKVIVSGSPDDVANQYTEDNFKVSSSESAAKKDNDRKAGLSGLVPRFDLTLVSDKNIITTEESLVFDITYEISEDLSVFPSFSFLCDSMGKSIFDVHKPDVISKSSGIHVYRYEVPLEMLNNANYSIMAVLRDAKTEDRIAYITANKALNFKINRKINGRKDNGLLNTKGRYIQVDGVDV